MWQQAGGEKFKFIVIDRPSDTSRISYIDMISRQLLAKDVSSSSCFISRCLPEVAKLECPKISALYSKIYRRLVDANNLNSFIEFKAITNQDMRLFIQCGEDRKFRSRLSGPHASYSNIFISADLIPASKSEDELAAIFAHEMAHIVLAHSERSVEVFKRMGSPSKLSQEQQKIMDRNTLDGENAADILGAKIAWNAGYNPYSGFSALKNYITYLKGPLFSKVWIYTNWNDNVHGSILERKSVVTNALKSFSFNVPLVSTSIELVEAKEEFKINSNVDKN